MGKKEKSSLEEAKQELQEILDELEERELNPEQDLTFSRTDFDGFDDLDFDSDEDYSDQSEAEWNFDNE